MLLAMSMVVMVVVLVNGAVFALVYLFSPRQGVVTTRVIRRRRDRPPVADTP